MDSEAQMKRKGRGIELPGIGGLYENPRQEIDQPMHIGNSFRQGYAPSFFSCIGEADRRDWSRGGQSCRKTDEKV